MIGQLPEADAPPPTADPASSPLLHVRDLAVSFASADDQRIQAVDGVSFTLYPRQTLAIVGESGCGKSVTALSILRLLPRPQARIDRGRATLYTEDKARDLLTMADREIRAVRGGDIAMIFQEPMSSLNPVLSVGEQIVEAVVLHQKARRAEAKARAIEAMIAVGIRDAPRRFASYPHEFSGGMRQRVMIAMALACRPRILLADEPTTALDVTVEAQILALLDNLKRTRGLAIVLITHDLGIVTDHADVVCVMYAGRVVEYAARETLFARPLHPYTRGLLACVPTVRERRERLRTVNEVVGEGSPVGAGVGDPGLIPWWPGHRPPAPLPLPDTPCACVEVEPGHWVGVWRTDQAAARGATPPDVRDRSAAVARA